MSKAKLITRFIQLIKINLRQIRWIAIIFAMIMSSAVLSPFVTAGLRYFRVDFNEKFAARLEQLTGKIVEPSFFMKEAFEAGAAIVLDVSILLGMIGSFFIGTVLSSELRKRHIEFTLSFPFSRRMIASSKLVSALIVVFLVFIAQVVAIIILALLTSTMLYWQGFMLALLLEDISLFAFIILFILCTTGWRGATIAGLLLLASLTFWFFGGFIENIFMNLRLSLDPILQKESTWFDSISWKGLLVIIGMAFIGSFGLQIIFKRIETSGTEF